MDELMIFSDVSKITDTLLAQLHPRRGFQIFANELMQLFNGYDAIIHSEVH
ncbi:hypothetical protein D3C76_1804200 [compost metagenome]